MIEETVFKSDNLKLFGRLFKTDSQNSKFVIFLHGGGSSNCYRFEYVQNILLENNISSFAFDFRGCGKSEGKFVDSSLNNRIVDAINAINFIGRKINIDNKNITISGGSMGGYVACRLLDVFTFNGIILQCPAAYAMKTENAPLDSEFSNLIRVENSFMDSLSFKSLKHFNGKKVVLYGEHDDVIPDAVKNKYKNIVGDKNYFMLKGGRHRLLSPDTDVERKALAELASLEVSFVNSL